MEIISSNQLLEIYTKYQSLRSELKSLEDKAQSLANRQAQLSRELDETRKKEKFLINKIEEQLGRTLTQEDLLEIIKNHG